MRARVALLLVAIACNGDPPAPPVEATVPEGPPGSGEAPPVPAAGEVEQAKWPLQPAWPAGEGRAWVPGSGRLVTPFGAVPVTASEHCDGGWVIASDQPPVGWLPEGDAVEFAPAPAVQAATVERVAWRLAEVLGPREGLQPGGRADPDPALFAGVEVRSVRKTRRQGPPVLVVVGERDGKAALAILDRDANEVLASDVFDLGEAAGAPPATLPAQDLDGDGHLDLVVWGDVREGDVRPGFRAVYRVDLGNEIALQRLGLVTTAGRRCGPPP